MKKVLLFLILFLHAFFMAIAQDESKIIRLIFDEALTDYTSWENLNNLCKSCKGRVTGSDEAAKAVDLTYGIMKGMNPDSVWKQPVIIPKWIRKEKETAYFQSPKHEKTNLHVAALGMSVCTGEKGLDARVIEVLNFEELERLGTNNIAGKIVFFNRPMDPKLINTFSAYGGAVNQRTEGASRAAAFGAVGAVIRSATTSNDEFPRTGVMRYNEKTNKIPAVAISTKSADLLSNALKEDSGLVLYFKTSCRLEPEVVSHNVIGEIRGSEFPDQIITIGGHLDAWDLGEGAHDDGAGCMQSIEVLRLFQTLGIKPKRTIRAVMFMDEEVAQRGGSEYARQAILNGEHHYFALEADRGAFMPRGFGVSAPEERLHKIISLKKYFEPYGISEIVAGGGGVDISPLRESGTPLSSFVPDMQRYFDYHHSANDTFESVHPREMELGSAAIAMLAYLISEEGL